jgi:hypothetical protein
MYQIIYEPLRTIKEHVSYIPKISDEEYELKYPSSEYTLIHSCEKFRMYLRKIDGNAYVEENRNENARK